MTFERLFRRRLGPVIAASAGVALAAQLGACAGAGGPSPTERRVVGAPIGRAIGGGVHQIPGLRRETLPPVAGGPPAGAEEPSGDGEETE